jgi:DNA-binding transcriptional regulator GbsR (MarR family)
MRRTLFGSVGSEFLEPDFPARFGGTMAEGAGSTKDAGVSETIAAYFCRMADTVGLPRSIALIYHALFVVDGPLSFGDIVERSGLSKASASTGLKMLERMRGIQRVMVPDDRRTFYRPELSLRRLVTGFMEESLRPGLEAGQRLLDQAESDAPADLAPILVERLASLRHWHQLTRDLLPVLSALDPS